MICLLLSLYVGGDVYDLASACPEEGASAEAAACLALDDPMACELIEWPNGDLTVEYKIWTDCTVAGQWLYSLTSICTVQPQRNINIPPTYRDGSIGTKPATEVSMLSPNDVKLSKGQPVKPVDPKLVMTSPITGKSIGVWQGQVVAK